MPYALAVGVDQQHGAEHARRLRFDEANEPIERYIERRSPGDHFQQLLLAVHFGGPGVHAYPQRAVPENQQCRSREYCRCEQSGIVVVTRIERELQLRSHPAGIDFLERFRWNTVVTALYEVAKLRPAARDGPMKGGGIERRSLAKFVRKRLLEKEILGRWTIHAEQPYVARACRVNQAFGARIPADRCQASLLEPICACATVLRSDSEAAHARNLIDAADAMVKENPCLHRGVDR